MLVKLLELALYVSNPSEAAHNGHSFSITFHSPVLRRRRRSWMEGWVGQVPSSVYSPAPIVWKLFCGRCCVLWYFWQLLTIDQLQRGFLEQAFFAVIGLSSHDMNHTPSICLFQSDLFIIVSFIQIQINVKYQ